MAGYEVGIVEVELLPYCFDEGGGMGEIIGPDISVLVLLVLHPMCSRVGASFLVDLQIDCLSVANPVVEL